MTLTCGSKLGPYEILSPIGSGGMGEVWKARDTRLGRIVAIKKVKEQHSERFKQEARTIAALNHPYICQLHDIGSDYLVLEYIEGKPLSSPLPEREAVRLAIQIATALEEAHGKGIIHRDLKPSNIMVTDKDAVKLLDFGLAKLYEQDASSSALPTADFPATQAGVVLGTVAYMSPEQAQGRPADARSDIFSFGLVLYEMLSGKRAFSCESPHVTVAALLRDEPPVLQTSPSLEKIVRKCLAKQPSGRYQTISEVKTSLEEVLEETQSKFSTEPQPSIAVLPFVNMSGDKEQEYFSDGLAEEIINALTQIPGLLVIARTSAFAFKGKNEDIRRIAEALGVANILEGSVRKAGNRIRVTAQLITAANGSHLWSERYDRDLTDVFAIQDEIAKAIAASLKVKLRMAIGRRYEPCREAHEAYLKAKYLWGMLEHLARNKEYLEQAVALDPQFALAYCGLADHHLMLANADLLPASESMPVVRERARKALDIDSSLPEAHALLGVVAAAYDYNWEEAEQRFHMAMAQDPVPPSVRLWYGFFFLRPVGLDEEAIDQQEQGIRGDPFNLVSRCCLAVSYLIAGKPREAELEAQRILEFEENYGWGLAVLALAYVHQNKWEESLKIAQEGPPVTSFAAGVFAGVLGRMLETRRAEELVQKLMPGDAYGAPCGLCLYHYLCGDIDKAADWLEKLIKQRHPQAGFLASLCFKSSPRWPAMARLMNLPEEAR
jgi:TolB-like protein/predicted Ser/Thr protein kinase